MNDEFEQKLKTLDMMFLELGMMVNVAVYRAVTGFTTHDKRLAYEVIGGDERINASQMKLEKKCLELIALQQPVTGALRQIITAMKASSDLERMGDHAVSIAKGTIQLTGNPRVFSIESNLNEMFAIVRKMSDEVLDAYVHSDDRRARRIASRDHRVNEFSRQIYLDCIASMRADTDTVVGGTDYMLVATYLERIADYVTNICERIVYQKTGKIVELNSNAKEDEF
ncbi:phosphate signaling complex protein PhoU [Lacticaseibacillus hulanensis]|uniref:phosphate signaling complex protein PhoU n=1 Tax=Lacticaseibacillus hulanensis TaxID=2493111 RepID=UPI000FDB7E8A|nr:phosphate signaling complex protein PhoU [Lacticaseibacillus hulanensis]